MSTTPLRDIEAQKFAQLSLEWKDLSYAIKGKVILSGVSGVVKSGEMLAVMGPSGAGKTTFLDIIAQRTAPTSGKMMVNGSESFDMSALGSYVEQNDALLGVLTVRETISFAARLSLDPSTPKKEIHDRVARTIAGLGLTEVSSNRIGTPIQRGISGGQKRRVTIGSALVTLPKILFLDEPTSGLDSRTSREVLTSIKNLATQLGMIVVASIHQPNWESISLFNRILILAQGKTMYSGSVLRLDSYLGDVLKHPVPPHANPTDHALDIVTTDFFQSMEQARTHVEQLHSSWKGHVDQYQYSETPDNSSFATPMKELSENSATVMFQGLPSSSKAIRMSFGRSINQTIVLMERNSINYGRNLLAYGVRLAMYLGMGVLLATVWVNLAQTDVKINDRLSIHFYSVAFLAFMSVAGIPAFLEERQVFIRERLNGLYGPGAYTIANTLCTLPYLFICSVVFSVLCYWSIGLHPGANAFFRFLAILFLAVFTAESQCILVAAVIPIFVAALAIASFFNGFWMCVGGYFIKAVNLPRFWYFWAHFIDYQTYAFDLLVVNDLRGLIFDCSTGADGICNCAYPSSLVAQGICKVKGDDVLNALDINGINSGLYAGILLVITLVYRVLFYTVLVFKKK